MMHIQKTRKRLEESIYIPTGNIENLSICSDSRSETQGKFGTKFRFFLSFKIEVCDKDTFNAPRKYEFRGVDRLKKNRFSAAMTSLPRISGLLVLAASI